MTSMTRECQMLMQAVLMQSTANYDKKALEHQQSKRMTQWAAADKKLAAMWVQTARKNAPILNSTF